MIHANKNEHPSHQEQDPSDTERVEPTPLLGHQTGRETEGPSGGDPPGSDDRREGRGHSPPHGGHWRDRPPTRIPGRRPVDPSEVLLQAFVEGDPEKAYGAAQELREAYHEALAEGSRLRFRLNFGSDLCKDCTGLRAGPGVVATCHQVQRCDFTNIKEGDVTPHHLRILGALAVGETLK